MTLAIRSHAGMLDVLGNWADRGWLRRLDIALVRFVAELSPGVDGTTLLAIALTANLEGQGHTCLVLPDLLADPDGLLGWSSDAGDALRFVLGRMPAATMDWTVALLAADVVGGPQMTGATPFVLDGDRFYLRRYWRHERRIATACMTRAETAVDIDERLAEAVLDCLFDRRAVAGEPDWQRIACGIALRSRITLITGGPGTGKTYTAARLLAAVYATAPDPATLRVALAAPTGKAAARLGQAITSSMALLAARVGDALPFEQWATRIGSGRTLHALLGTQRDSRRFRHDTAHPLDLDLLIVDEASMVHVEMMDALLAALPAHASLVLIGDRDQLSSVEAGAVLGELCATGSALARQTCVLRRSERFGGAIARLALAVNAGRIADARAAIGGGDATLALVETTDAAAASDRAARGYAAFVAAIGSPPDSLLGEDHDAWVRGVLEAFDAFRVLCAVREGEWGVAGLNRAIERASGFATAVADAEWYEGRPVIATRNDYDLGIFNGDVGIALRASASDTRLRVWFVADGDEKRVRSVSASRLADVETAFAMTVHRAQGSEFEAVMLVLPPESSRVVTRELLYTGITRARSGFTLFTARPEAFDEAIQRTTRRASGIAAMLRA